MAKASKAKQPTQQLGKERKETRQERRIRLEREYEARQECMKVLPYVLVAIGLFFVLFALWVRSIPPKGIPIPTMENLTENYTNAPVKAPKEELSEAPAEEPGMTITEDL
mmetsp:Transcript_27527/g.39405  ORF Transcript_27527/g.39405 Transcript_27527/m.39405 type:complete len:110 (-) Transcript_27527:321-650(-)